MSTCNDADPYKHVNFVKFYSYLFNPLKLFEYLLQKNIDFYPLLLKSTILTTINETKM